MTIDEIKKDVRFWQRMLRLAGYYKGKIDGIRGPLQRAAEAQWDAEAAAARAKYGSFDDRTEMNLATVIPAAQGLMRQFMAKAVPAAKAKGVTIKLIQGTRSYAEQDALYAQGRTKPGAKVTNARGGYSLHNFGVAVDFGLFTHTYLGDSPHYKTLGRIACDISGLIWGGNFTSITDYPHIQMGRWGSGSAALRSIF